MEKNQLLEDVKNKLNNLFNTNEIRIIIEAIEESYEEQEDTLRIDSLYTKDQIKRIRR